MTPVRFYRSGVNSRWYWTATAPNGKHVADCAQGNGYASKRGAEKGAYAALQALSRWEMNT